MPDPSWREEVRARLAGVRLTPTREAEIVEELAQHLEERWRELTAAGSPPDEATRLTLAEFRGGNALAQYLAPLRQAHPAEPITPGVGAGRLLGDLRQDLRYAARLFSKQPAFAAAAVVTLALGIGATTAIFSVVYGVLLKPLPFPESGNLVSLMHSAPGLNLAAVNHGPATYLTYRDNQQTFEAIGAWESDEVSITGRGEPEQVEALTVAATTLPVLRVQPRLGRLFDGQDDAPGAPPRALLSHGYWQRRFGGTSAVLGQALEIDGRLAEVIGVLPSSFKFLDSNADVLLPMQLDEANAPRGIMFDFQALARLKPGVTLAQADADVARMIRLLPPAFAVLELQPRVRPLAADVIGNVGQVLWILLAAVGAVLLIACANVANLFLVRAEGRHQEFAMRAALGASANRIARALLAESLLLALAGGAVGILLAQGAIGLLRRLAPIELPRVDEIGIDWAVLLFTIGLAILSGLLFGVMPLLKFGRPDAAALKEGGRSSSAAPGRHRLRNTLVVAEIALALTLMIVSGLMMRTFVAMRQVEPGFTQPEQVQTFRVAIPERLISDATQFARTHESLTQRLTRVAGVASVGLSSSITMDGEDNTNPLYVEDAALPEGQLPPLRRFKSVGPGYFETIGNRLVAGRPISWTDIYQRHPVVMISENLARQYWQEPSRALGRRVRGPSPDWHEIVGVVANAHDDGLNQPATAMVYWPMLDDTYPRRTMAYAVRSSRAGTAAFVRELQQAVWSVNASLPLAAVQTLEEIRARSMAQTSFAVVMLAIGAAVALLLGVTGIFGVIAHVAAQRTREIGIRMALGAQIGDVRRLFLRQGLRLTALGLGLGIAAALVTTRVMAGLLFGVTPIDPLTYAAVSAALGVVAMLAAYLPARRAARVDPVVALRADAR
jgi:putative ABC transport system permease protein